MKIGSRIKQARENAGMTQKELSNLVGTTQAALCRIEKDRHNPSLPNLVKILGALSIKFEDLLDVEFIEHCRTCKRPWTRGEG